MWLINQSLLLWIHAFVLAACATSIKHQIEMGCKENMSLAGFLWLLRWRWVLLTSKEIRTFVAVSEFFQVRFVQPILDLVYNSSFGCFLPDCTVSRFERLSVSLLCISKLFEIYILCCIRWDFEIVVRHFKFYKCKCILKELPTASNLRFLLFNNAIAFLNLPRKRIFLVSIVFCWAHFLKLNCVEMIKYCFMHQWNEHILKGS